MRDPQTFGECLTELLREKRISTADLTRRMNYRSKTSISRLLRDEVRYSSIEDFMSRLEPVSAWFMTGPEMQRLKDAMEVSRLGRSRYRTYRDIWKLVRRPEEGRTGEIRAERFGQTQVETLHELAQSWFEAERLEMVILNSGYESLFKELAELLNRNPEKEISICHYLTVHDASGSMAQQMGALMAVFHDPRYQSFYKVCRDEGDPIFARYGRGNHMMAIRGEKKDGEKLFQMISMQDEQNCLVYENGLAEDFYEFYRRTAEETCKGALPMKTQYPEQELLEGLIVISQRYLSCELDRATCCLAPNICFELIPFEILYRVMFDSVLEGVDPASEQIRQLSRVHQARYANIHGKKKPTAFIFSWEGLRNFAQTGRTTDHVAGMREFTPEERAAILRDVAKKCRENVYLRVHVLPPEIRVRGMTLTTHGGLGVYLLDAYTQYDVVKGHSEAFILMPEFTEVLEEFFRDELIEKYAFSEAESLEMLESLADGLDTQDESFNGSEGESKFPH